MHQRLPNWFPMRLLVVNVLMFPNFSFTRNPSSCFSMHNVVHLEFLPNRTNTHGYEITHSSRDASGP
ncbi:hypothetical protein Y032_0227g2806 [Ancylostoma ceylanicum]|uniref:Secreted protein n=1 Tax=Ancylostoma ceylanicum TaxID=53326 RepID=A0A016SHM4_9BILA|nr:hypothetical protein Y032_0227g2806 [Ancylostoma ceylanicum]